MKAPVDALPAWDLTDLYGGIDDPSIASDLDALAQETAAFRRDCENRLADFDGRRFAAAIGRIEEFADRLGRVEAYAELVSSVRQDDPLVARFNQDAAERVNGVRRDLIFFELEICRLDDGAIEKFLRDGKVARYRPWLDSLRARRPHLLSDEAESMLHELSPVRDDAWRRLFDETAAGLRFEIGGKLVNGSQAHDMLCDDDAATRRAAGRELARVYRSNERLFALVTNTLARSKAIEDGWRRHARPISARNLDNRIEDETVDALIGAVRRACPGTSHRYHALKARWLGVDRLPWWDRVAPLPGDDRVFTWDEARELVLDAFRAFSPRMAAIAREFFARRWIDAGVHDGKQQGAFSHPTVPSAHPFVMLNFQGRARDVMTLAHELGHGVHQVLAAGQGALLAPTPLTLAETASVFGEQLAFRRLLALEEDPARRRAVLTGKVEEMLGTVVRQVAFCEFERRVHDERREGELTPERIGEIWMETQAESLGPSVALDDDYRIFWCYIPHFVHTPFYVYAYAFGDCLVNALYARYLEAPDGFEGKFLAMLEAGGSKLHGELLAPFGLDATDPAFWARGLRVIEESIDELEALTP